MSTPTSNPNPSIGRSGGDTGPWLSELLAHYAHPPSSAPAVPTSATPTVQPPAGAMSTTLPASPSAPANQAVTPAAPPSSAVLLRPTPFGSTRTRYHRDHALIAPDSLVPSQLPGWEKSRLILLIGPHIGARFSQYFALMDPGGIAGPAAPGVERMLFVLEGELVLKIGKLPSVPVSTGGYAYLPPNLSATIRAGVPTRLTVFEKRYLGLPGVHVPEPVVGREFSIPGQPFLGDPDARLQVLLPDNVGFDMAVNIFTYQPGATLPQVECHVMEHGLLMLTGAGVYRLSDQWYPVAAGDVIWIAPCCPQWFVAMGKVPARYLYYKDVNRDPLDTVAG